MSEFKEYKSGDKVIVRKNKKLCLPNFNYMAVHTIVHVVDIPLGQRVQLDSFPEGSYVSSEAVDLATDEEIAAGHRIDNDMGDDSHIENHISPLCKSKDV
ncbi:hypothetical protein MW335_003582 [Acinetobacter baumannii]|uniref:hypothetical protein n=1 Tax=Acinetobacter baumannii TaxID=470 RepID=UPI0026ECB44B|nr:hypothetical protein [Acinetobacter baumannii]MDO7201882.1 hypothetical protein [Acinetobacter baumannii]